MEPRDILKTIPFFAEVLTPDELDELAVRAYFIEWPKGATPIEEDGPGKSMFVIGSGEALVTIAGEKEPIARLSKGDIVGEMSLLTGARRSATVTAASDVEAMEINKEALAHVLKTSPTLVDRFAELIDRRQRRLHKLAGSGAWGMHNPGKAETARMIRAFFSSAI
ncbi:MAG TPA: cyclic nucleotide-binding domain-containing protein [Bauldia sp.]|nr:cyclic nucleotide-binding domain-containing protein [Bauldia sp.]